MEFNAIPHCQTRYSNLAEQLTMNQTTLRSTRRRRWGLHHLIYLLMLAVAALHAGGCTPTPSAPEGEDSFDVVNIAVWDGAWKDPQVKAHNFFGGLGAVRCIRQSPVNPNDLLIAGNFGVFEHVANNNWEDGMVNGLVLLSLRAGFRPLEQEGRDQSTANFYTAEFTTVNVPYYYAGGVVTMPYPGNDTVTGAGRFADDERYWSQFNPEFPLVGNVYAMARQGNTLFIGGDFASPGMMENSGALLQYDLVSQQLSSMATGYSAPPTYTAVRALEADGNGVIAGGLFYQMGGVTVNNIARWNGSSWEAIGDGIQGTVYDIIRHNGTLYIAGMFYPSGYDGYGICARWDGSTWKLVGPVFQHGSDYGNEGYALASFQGKLIIGGHFRKLGGVTVNNIAQLSQSGNTWEPLAGGGIQGPDVEEERVNTLCVVSDRLYIGGTFDKARVQ